MMAKTLAWLALAGALSITSCALIRDFDELQKGGDSTGGDNSTDGGGAGMTATAGTSGAAGAAATAQSGGAAGSGTPTCDCDDNDPCTRDTCNAAGECIHRTNGAVSDGVTLTLDDDDVQAISLTANGRGFYAAVTVGDETASEVQLYSLANEGTSLQDGPALSDSGVLRDDALRAVPGAAVALLARTEAPLTVAAFAALTDAPESATVADGSAGQVWAVNLNEQLEPLEPISAYGLPSGTNGDYVVGQRGPIAWQASGEAHVAWIDVGGTLQLHTVGGITRTLGEAGLSPTVIAPIGTAASPGLLWFGATPEQAYAEFPAAIRTRTPINGCDNQGLFIAADTARLNEGLWSVTWTRLALGPDEEVVSLNAEGHTLLCAAGTCGFTPNCTGQPYYGGYGGVIAATTRQSEPGVVYQATVSPAYLAGGTATATLQIHWAEIMENGRYLALIAGGGRRITDAPLSSAQVEFSAGSRLAVAWVEEDEATGRGEAHIERLRLCPPTATDIATAADI